MLSTTTTPHPVDSSSSSGPLLLPSSANGRQRYAVLLLCEGAPEDLSLLNVASFLRLLLLSPRVVDLPRWLWLPLFYGFVLPCKIQRTRRMYMSSWVNTPALSNTLQASSKELPGSHPAAATSSRGEARVVYTLRQLGRMVQHILPALCAYLKEVDTPLEAAIQVEVAFWGQRGSIDSALERFRHLGNYAGVVDDQDRPMKVEDEHLIVLPLYPQYCSTTSAVAFDAVMGSKYFARHRTVPHLHYIRSYCHHACYIQALEEQIRQFICVHGIPDWLCVVFERCQRRLVTTGDCYQSECVRSFQLLRDALSQEHHVASPLGGTTSSTSSLEFELRGTLSKDDGGSIGSSTTETHSQPTVYPMIVPANRITMSFLVSDESLGDNLGPTLPEMVRRISSRVRSRNVTPRNSHSLSPERDMTNDLIPFVPSPTDDGLGRVFVIRPGCSVDNGGSADAVQEGILSLLHSHGWNHIAVIPALNDSPRHAHMIARVVSGMIV